MQIIIDADRVELKDGKVIINYDGSRVLPIDMAFNVQNNEGSKLMDCGWVRITRNHTLSLQRVK